MIADRQNIRQDIHNSDLPVLCRACEARHRGICGTLEPGELFDLSRSARLERHGVGDRLAGEDTEIHSYANVMKGVVKLSKVLEDGRQQVVGLQFAPDFLGRLYGQENDVTAEAASEVDLCVISKRALESVVSSSPALSHRLMLQVLRELDEARDWMVTLGRKTAQEKVASFLYLIATHIDPAIGRADRFELPLSRADIADFLGLTIETVSRQITKLRREGVIEVVSNRQITVPDLEALRARCA